MATVTITNTQWARLTLQVRVGDQNVAENNPIDYEGVLNRGDNYTKTFPVFLFYRRDNNPDAPDGTYSAWTLCFADQNIDNP
jgi:hypothetical protein